VPWTQNGHSTEWHLRLREASSGQNPLPVSVLGLVERGAAQEQLDLGNESVAALLGGLDSKGRQPVGS
jgi:hypothetical protein